MPRTALCWMTVIYLAAPIWGQASKAPNLVPNGEMEGAAGKLPPHWEHLIIGAPSELVIDREVKRAGAQSVRLTAREVTRSYAHSGEIEVAPGERVTISAWVKVKGVPADQGRAQCLAEFSRGHGTKEAFVMVGFAKVDEADWQRIENTIEVPANQDTLRLRLGLAYSLGTTWWDDVTVTAQSSVVSRVALPGPRISPAMEGLPLEILNRDGSKGAVVARATVGKEKGEQRIQLSGKSVQPVTVPVKIAGRGNMELSADLFRGETQLSRETRKALVPPPMVLLPPIPTHWVIEDGEARVEGEVDLAVSKGQLEGGMLTARIVDSGGAEKGAWSSAGRGLSDGINTFTMASMALPAGEYKLVVELKPRQGDALRAERAWSVIPRSAAKVTINADGYPVAAGKPIFPLGVFNGAGRMKEPGASAFSVTHAYNSVEAEVGGRLDDNRALDFLDNSHANGMKALMLIPRQLLFAENWDGVRRRVRMFRNHPGLLAWDEEEGMARGDMKIATLAKLREVLKEEDPHHPLMVGDAKDVIGRIEPARRDFFPLDHMDLGMWWWYPIPLGGGKPEALEGDEGKPGSHELSPPSFLVNRNTDKPIWVGVQSYKKPKNGRYPNPTEYRAQAYIALIHGAKGLMWYGGSVTGGAYLKPEEANWEYVKTLAGELRELSPVLMGKTLEAPKFSPANAPLSVMLKQAEGRTVLLAVNRGSKPVEVTIESPSLKAGKIRVLREGRDVTAEAGKLKVGFEPYAVHVYELSP